MKMRSAQMELVSGIARRTMKIHEYLSERVVQ